MLLPPRHLFRARVHGILQEVRNLGGSLSPKELLYQGIFRDAAAALGLQLPPLYPLGGAANYSLLYVLLRALTETPCTRLLEIGVGQSTRLVDAVSTRRGNLDVLSIDSDAYWARSIGEQVRHTVIHAPLVQKSLHGIEATDFDLPPLDRTFDMVIVDGPMGSKRNSRWAALEMLDQYLAEEFIVVFDDAERLGEQDTIKEFVRSCKRKDLKSRFTQATKAQCLIFTPAFGAAEYF